MAFFTSSLHLPLSLGLWCQRYLTALRREKEAFQQLIKDRAVSEGDEEATSLSLSPHSTWCCLWTKGVETRIHLTPPTPAGLEVRVQRRR